MKVLRIAVTVVAIVCSQTIVCALAAAPSVFAWYAVMALLPAVPPWRAAVISVLLAPLYVLFALCLMPISAVVTRIVGARTPGPATLTITEMSWDLMQWAHYMVATHLVRVVAGTLFRGSPVWTAYVRMNGARIGRRVFINTLSIADHNMLEFGDDVVIGSDVHISGHTVENGIVKTGPVRLGSNVTVGLGSVIEIDVDVEPHCQIGALTFVAKHSRLESHTVYIGIPARPLGTSSF